MADVLASNCWFLKVHDYLLVRQLSDTELMFRGCDDYVSKYRRVLEYFDAFKVGLTASPAAPARAFSGRLGGKGEFLRYPAEDDVYEKPILDRLHLFLDAIDLSDWQNGRVT